MQAFRAAATIDEESQLHLANIPFRPGTTVDVIVLERETRSEAAATEGGNQRQLAEEQHRLAKKHPGEHVVLVGDQIVYHGRDRQEAVRAYQRAGLDHPSLRPVFVSPGDEPKRPLVTRGRALTRKRDGLR